jgi:hypothetical protein
MLYALCSIAALPPRAFLAAFAVFVLFAALFLSALLFQTDRATGAIAGTVLEQRCVVLIGLHESFIFGTRYSLLYWVNMTNLIRCNDFSRVVNKLVNRANL